MNEGVAWNVFDSSSVLGFSEARFNWLPSYIIHLDTGYEFRIEKYNSYDTQDSFSLFWLLFFQRTIISSVTINAQRREHTSHHIKTYIKTNQKSEGSWWDCFLWYYANFDKGIMPVTVLFGASHVHRSILVRRLDRYYFPALVSEAVRYGRRCSLISYLDLARAFGGWYGRLGVAQANSYAGRQLW